MIPVSGPTLQTDPYSLQCRQWTMEPVPSRCDCHRHRLAVGEWAGNFEREWARRESPKSKGRRQGVVAIFAQAWILLLFVAIFAQVLL